MMHRVILAVLALGICLGPTPAQFLPSQGDPTIGTDPTVIAAQPVFESWSVLRSDGLVDHHFVLTGASGSEFAVLASLGGEAFDPTAAVTLGVAPLDPTGYGQLALVGVRPTHQPLHAVAAFESCGCVILLPDAVMILDDPIVCDHLDFDFTLGDDSVMVAGRKIAEQWADIGMHVRAENAVPGKPDKAILFDSDVPSSHDPDLVVGLGQLLIIPEDDTDIAPRDGLVDVPDDAAAGGSLYFDFERGVQIDRVTLVDIDEVGTELRIFQDHDTTTPVCVIPVPQDADGSVQTIAFHKTGVTRLEVFLKGSGAVAGVCGIPCPRVVNFDETPFGAPLDHQPGLRVTDQFWHAGTGVEFGAINAWVGGTGDPGQNHPDVALLFDSDHPTGGDPDLGCGLGNILIIAEDDLDVAPFDGLVDDPDDEAQGGLITVRFGWDVHALRLTLVDVDEAVGPNEVRCYDADDVMLGAPIPLRVGPDGNVQFVTAEAAGMRRLEIALCGSGALAELRYCIE